MHDAPEPPWPQLRLAHEKILHTMYLLGVFHCYRSLQAALLAAIVLSMCRV